MLETAIHQLLSESAQKTSRRCFSRSLTQSRWTRKGRLAKSSRQPLVFQGAPPGRFGLLVSETVATNLAVNFVGCDDRPQLPPGQVAGVMGELANMLCGMVLSELESYNNFDLGAPEPVLVGADEPGPDLPLDRHPSAAWSFPKARSFSSCLLAIRMGIRVREPA